VIFFRKKTFRAYRTTTVSIARAMEACARYSSSDWSNLSETSIERMLPTISNETEDSQPINIRCSKTVAETLGRRAAGNVNDQDDDVDGTDRNMSTALTVVGSKVAAIRRTDRQELSKCRDRRSRRITANSELGYFCASLWMPLGGNFDVTPVLQSGDPRPSDRNLTGRQKPRALEIESFEL